MAVFTLESSARLWIRTAGARTISALIAVIGALKTLGDIAGDYGPAVLVAPWGQGGGGRQGVTTQSSPSESLEVKRQGRLVQSLTEKQGI